MTRVGRSMDGENPHEHEEARAPSTRRTLLVGTLVAVVLLAGALGATALLGGERSELDTGVAATLTDTSGLPAAGEANDVRGEPLPDLTLAGFAGAEPVELAAYRGRPVVVNMWASWCAPCVAEMPHFNKVAGEVAGEVVFLGVDTQDAPANAEPFARELEIAYDLAADPDAELFSAVGGFGMPTTLFVDADGIIRHRVTGPLDEEELRSALREHLGIDA